MQFINFYFEEYRPKPLSFDSRFAAIVLLISLISVLILGWLESSEVDNLQQQLQAKKDQVTQLQQQISIIQKQLSRNSAINDLQRQLESGKKELNRYRKVIDLVKTPIAHQMVPYSQILTDLTEQKNDSVWLTKIEVQAENLSLHGTTTKADAVPLYVDGLKQSRTLKRYFDELKIERDEEDKRLINFQLLNGRLINDQ